MKFLYHGASEVGGVYRILNVENGRIYIGSTGTFRKRAYGHFHNLANNRHQNTFLQNDWNKCGPDAFIFEVIEVVQGEKEQRLIREQVFIDQHYDTQKNCYNLAKDAFDTRSGTRNKETPDPLTDKRCHSPSQETLEKRSLAIKQAYEDPALREVSRQNALKKWEGHSANVSLTHLETGEVVEVTGSLREFAMSRGISYKALHQLVKGKIKSSSGWHLTGQAPVYVSQKGQKRKPLTAEHRARIAGNKTYSVLSPSGEIVTVSGNIKEFCREKGLDYTTFSKVLRGIGKSYSGYRHI